MYLLHSRTSYNSIPCRAFAVATKFVCCGWNVHEWNEPSNDSATTSVGWSCSPADDAERKSYKWIWPSSVAAMKISLCCGWTDKQLIGDDSRKTSTNSSEGFPLNPRPCCFSMSCIKICSSLPVQWQTKDQSKGRQLSFTRGYDPSIWIIEFDRKDITQMCCTQYCRQSIAFAKEHFRHAPY